MTAIIFDIDGTLIESMDFDSELHIQAVKKVLGDVSIHDDWGKYQHVTDPGILHQIIRENHVSEAKKKAMEVRKYFGELMSSHLRLKPCKPKKGAIEAINNIAARPKYVVGYATGGWNHTAIMKLKSAGLYNDPLVYSFHGHRIGIRENDPTEVSGCRKSEVQSQARRREPQGRPETGLGVKGDGSGFRPGGKWRRCSGCSEGRTWSF